METRADFITEIGRLRSEVKECKFNNSRNCLKMAKENRGLKDKIESLNNFIRITQGESSD